MNPNIVIRHVDHIYHEHPRGQAEFTVPSAVHLGHQVVVRRLDENSRSVSHSDIYFVMHAPVSPGACRVINNYTHSPANRFAVYVTAEQSQQLLTALPPPKHQDRARSV